MELLKRKVRVYNCAATRAYTIAPFLRILSRLQISFTFQGEKSGAKAKVSL